MRRCNGATESRPLCCVIGQLRPAVSGGSKKCEIRLPRGIDDILDAKVGEWVDSCPSTAGGKNWHPMSFHRPSRQVIIPLSQTCMSLRAQAIEQKAGGGSGGGADRRYYTMPGTN